MLGIKGFGYRVAWNYSYAWRGYEMKVNLSCMYVMNSCAILKSVWFITAFSLTSSVYNSFYTEVGEFGKSFSYLSYRASVLWSA